VAGVSLVCGPRLVILIIIRHIQPVIASRGVCPGCPGQKIILILSLNSAAVLTAQCAWLGSGTVLKNRSAPRDPIKAGSAKASVQSSGLICSSVDGPWLLVVGIDILKIVVILVVDIKSFTMNKTFTTFCFLWLLLFGGNFIIKGFKLVQEIGIHYIMIIP